MGEKRKQCKKANTISSIPGSQNKTFKHLWKTAAQEKTEIWNDKKKKETPAHFTCNQENNTFYADILKTI